MSSVHAKRYARWEPCLSTCGFGPNEPRYDCLMGIRERRSGSGWRCVTVGLALAPVFSSLPAAVHAQASRATASNGAAGSAASRSQERARAPREPRLEQDPSLDRGFLMSTARLQPAGSVTFHDRLIVFPGFTFSAGPAQVGLTFFGVGGTLEARVGLWDTPRLSMVIEARGGGLRLGTAIPIGAAALAGIVASYCIDRRCAVEITASAAAGEGGYRPTQENQSNPDVRARLVQGGALLSLRPSRRLKLMLEMQWLYARECCMRSHTFFSTVFGARVHGRRASLDFGLMAVGAIDDQDSGYSIPAPWLGFGYRWD